MSDEKTDRSEKGYHKRFDVTRASTGEVVDERTFTLIPSRDPAARVALEAYARAAKEFDGNDDLYDDVDEWLSDLSE